MLRSEPKMFLARLLGACFIVLACTTARAAVESPEVLAGVAAYNDMDYEKAIELLQKAVGQTLTREERVVANRTLASCHVAVNKPELAIVDFENVLRIDEAFELDRTTSPRERAAFEEAKTRVAMGTVEPRGGRALP